MRALLGAMLGVLVGVALVLLGAPTATPLTSPQDAPQGYLLSDARERWAFDLATRLGNPQPSWEVVQFITAWTLAEDRSDGALARNNPLNTTETNGAVLTINGDGVRGYPDYESGMAATVRTLGYAHAGYAEIVAGIVSNDPEHALRGLYASPWGTDAGAVEAIYRQALTRPQNSTQQATRRALVEYALSLVGMPYVRGGRSATGGDCSGTMQHIYLTVAGIDIGATTFEQYPRLRPIDLTDVQDGDLWYGQYSNDQHTGMVADVDGDGRFDLINNGGLQDSMHVDYDFLSNPYFVGHTMGFRRAL